jgi:Flp pilus assembly protein TadG
MSTRFSTLARWRRAAGGNALVELAVALPLLCAVLLGTIDFGRLFYTTMAVTLAVKSGAQYGAQSYAKSSDTSGMQSAATSAASDISGFTPTASQFCTCPNASSSVACTGTPCGAGVSQWVYAKVVGTATFSTLVSYPGIPSTVTVNRTAKMRVK